MKFRMLVLTALLLTPTTIGYANTPCTPFRVVDVVRRVLNDGPSDRVTLFDLRKFKYNILLRPPTAKYNRLLHRGNRIVVVGNRCDDTDFIATSIKRVR